MVKDKAKAKNKAKAKDIFDSITPRQLAVSMQLEAKILIYCQRHSKIDPFYLKNGKVKLTPLISY